MKRMEILSICLFQIAEKLLVANEVFIIGICLQMSNRQSMSIIILPQQSNLQMQGDML